MAKKNQNIILGLILVILIACSIFTGLAIKDKSGNTIDITSFPNNNFEVDNSNSTRRDRPSGERPSGTRPSGERSRPSRGSGNGFPNDGNFSREDMKEKFDFKTGNLTKMNNKDIDLYLVLFGLENLFSGAVIMYLIILNTKKEDKKLKLFKK